MRIAELPKIFPLIGSSFLRMGRTSDQAKFLFFGLLRTVSALASTDHKVVPYAATVCTKQVHVGPEITLRLARKSDVPGIQRCNLATLPENYNLQFYANHLRQWPELALVAESSEPSSVSGHENRRLVLKPDVPMYSQFINTKPEPNIVAYVIGKVEEHLEMDLDQDDKDWGLPATSYRSERLGHVTSLAVLQPYRRRGLAQALLEQLHHHMTACYGVKSVGLHVRQSNVAAERLYHSFGYTATERIPEYYQDGEDAFLMKKRLPHLSMRSQNHKPLFGTLRRSNPWDNGPAELRLPRIVGKMPSLEPAGRSADDEAAPEELLTGTM